MSYGVAGHPSFKFKAMLLSTLFRAGLGSVRFSFFRPQSPIEPIVSIFGSLSSKEFRGFYGFGALSSNADQEMGRTQQEHALWVYTLGLKQNQ